MSLQQIYAYVALSHVRYQVVIGIQLGLTAIYQKAESMSQSDQHMRTHRQLEKTQQPCKKRISSLCFCQSIYLNNLALNPRGKCKITPRGIPYHTITTA